MAHPSEALVHPASLGARHDIISLPGPSLWACGAIIAANVERRFWAMRSCTGCDFFCGGPARHQPVGRGWVQHSLLAARLPVRQGLKSDKPHAGGGCCVSYL